MSQIIEEDKPDGRRAITLLVWNPYARDFWLQEEYHGFAEAIRFMKAKELPPRSR